MNVKQNSRTLLGDHMTQTHDVGSVGCSVNYSDHCIVHYIVLLSLIILSTITVLICVYYFFLELA